MKKRRSSRNSGLISEKVKIKIEDDEKPGPTEYFADFELPAERPKYICSVCQKSFSDKNCLKKHIKKIHQLEPEPFLQDSKQDKDRIAPFKCRVCETEFAYKRNLKRHLIKYHSQGLEDEEGGNCFCNVEGCKFRSFFINALRTHLTEEHKVQIDIENKTFNSKAEFDCWKEEEEKTNVCLFIKEAGKHTLINGDQRLIYQCHRSGHYSGHGNGKRSFRIKGTCKLGKRCTAGIELTVKKRGDIHEVVYYKTHIWHTPDVAHVNLSASERAFLANKLREGASISSILESVKADKSAEGTNFCKRIHLLKRKDLVNIENTFRLNNTERHIKKQHKRGQKIDRENIKKNIDDYGEVVSWVVESPTNACEYFTVKKLQPEKCAESCGVICSFCDVCLHMFSCTCHDYLLYGTMCQHIHSISLSLLPVQKCKRVSKPISQGNNVMKRKRKEKIDILKESNDTEHKESDIINFLTKNLELQREQEAHQERMKLKEKVDVFNNFFLSKIDHLSDISVQQLMKIMDSTIEVLNQTTNSLPQLVSAPLQSANTVSSVMNTVVHHQTATATVTMAPNHMLVPNTQHNVNMPHDNQNVSKCVATMQSFPVNIPERKYEIPVQYYPNIKKKRKIEEASFYRPPIVEKRAVFDNMPNEHAILPDNYSSFDCNLSWQTPTISTGANPAAKWWT